jgi:hypothetical protein
MSLAAWTAIWGIASAFPTVPGIVVLTTIFSVFDSMRPLAVRRGTTYHPTVSANASGAGRRLGSDVPVESILAI